MDFSYTISSLEEHKYNNHNLGVRKSSSGLYMNLLGDEQM